MFLLAGIVAFINVCASRLARVIDRARVVENVGPGDDRRLSMIALVDEICVLDQRIRVVNRGDLPLGRSSSLLVCAVVILLFASEPARRQPRDADRAALHRHRCSRSAARFAIFIYETRLGSRVIHIRNEILYHRADDEKGGFVQISPSRLREPGVSRVEWLQPPAAARRA